MLGLGSAARPEFHTTQRRSFNPAEAATRFATLNGAGLDLREDEVYEQTGYTPPAPGEKVVKGKSQAPPPSPLAGFPGFGGPSAAPAPGREVE
jgi:hypothetical protein